MTNIEKICKEVEREPLYLSRLTHNGEPGHLYVAGREGGVLFEVM